MGNFAIFFTLKSGKQGLRIQGKDLSFCRNYEMILEENFLHVF